MSSPESLAAGLAACLFLAAPASAQTEQSGGALRPDQACFDVDHYELVLAVVPDRKLIAGSLTMTATVQRPTKLIALDLDGRFKVHRVTVGEAVTDATHEEGRLRIPLPGPERAQGEELKVSVLYSGAPRVAPNPPWVGGFTWSETPSGAPWIATSCQMEGADLWWPCKDHPSDKPDSFDLKVTVPAGLVCVSNGRLAGVTQGDQGARTFHWHTSTPIANYSIALNIAPYDAITRKVKSVAGDTYPVTFWHLPESAEKAPALFEEILDHLAHMESVCGPYPFRVDKYGVVETPHLGMEHQTIIAYGNQFRGDPNFDYDWLHHHELSHEWWANLVTCDDWADFWIHEGFGTYMQALYLESRFGEEAYRKKLEVDWKRVSNAGPIAPRAPRATQDMYFAGEGSDAPGGDIYFKGSWFLHNLRWLMGDEPFFRFLRRLTYPRPESEQDAAHPPVHFLDTAGVVKAATAAAGTDLQWYFDAVVRQKELPVLEVWAEDRTLHLQWRTANGRPYPMPVEVLVEGEAVRVDCPSGHGRLDVGTRTWEVDPKRWLLRKR